MRVALRGRKDRNGGLSRILVSENEAVLFAPILLLAFSVIPLSTHVMAADGAPSICEVQLVPSGKAQLLSVHASPTEHLSIVRRPKGDDKSVDLAIVLDNHFRQTKTEIAITRSLRGGWATGLLPIVGKTHYAFVWKRTDAYKDKYEIEMAIFDRAARTLTPPLVLDRPTSFPFLAAAAPTTNGGLVVAWWQMSGDAPETHVRVVSSSHQVVGKRIQVPTKGREFVYEIVPMANGGFTIMWDSEAHFFEFFWARRYLSDGNSQGTQFQVPRLPLTVIQGDFSHRIRPNEVGLADDRFVYGQVMCGRRLNSEDYGAINVGNSVWLQGKNGAFLSAGSTLSTECKLLVTRQASSKKGYRVEGRVFSEAGIALGESFQLSAPNLKLIRSVDTKPIADGRFFVAWEETLDNKLFEKRARVVDPHGRPRCSQSGVLAAGGER